MKKYMRFLSPVIMVLMMIFPYNIVKANSIPGDADGNGQVNVLDVIRLINVVFDNQTANFGADCDANSSVNVLDVICVINLVFSSPPPSETLTGVFVDAPVQGLGYQTPSHQGTTNDSGEFNYESGETVSFFLDGIQLGSVAAQPTVPVTLLPGSLILARILLTLDHDADPNKIDISGIVLDDNLKAQLAAILSGDANAPELSVVLTDAKLSEIQTNSGVSLVHLTLVDTEYVANHLALNIDAVAFNISDLSNKFFISSDGGGLASDSLAAFIFRADGAGEMIGSEINPFTWSMNNDGTANITINGETAVGTKLSQSDNRTVIHVQDINEAFIREWYAGLPLSYADIDGKHFAMDTGVGGSCSARTLSFSNSTVTVNEQCNGGFFTFVAQVLEHDQLENVIIMRFPENDGEVTEIHFALVDGTLADGKYGAIEYENSVVREGFMMLLLQVDTPLSE